MLEASNPLELLPAEFGRRASSSARHRRCALASDAGTNRFVAALLGVARGAPTLPWRERLGAQLGSS
jgi:hypothetical protein